MGGRQSKQGEYFNLYSPMEPVRQKAIMKLAIARDATLAAVEELALERYREDKIVSEGLLAIKAASMRCLLWGLNAPSRVSADIVSRRADDMADAVGRAIAEMEKSGELPRAIAEVTVVGDNGEG